MGVASARTRSKRDATTTRCAGSQAALAHDARRCRGVDQPRHGVRCALARADEAIAAYRQALAIDPGALAAHVNLGNALQQTGDIDGAVAALETARALAPGMRPRS